VYLVYQPEGSEEPTRWVYNPRKLMSAEREAIERQTGLMYSEFTQAVVQGIQHLPARAAVRDAQARPPDHQVG
jgi:hypothetical protein